MLTQETPRKFGRLPRARNPAVPHMAALMAGRLTDLAPVPASYDYASQRLPADVGALGNLTAGNCTSAGKGHAVQLWYGSTEPVNEAATLQDYREATGWSGIPGDATDVGAVEQDTLKRWLTQGYPLATGQRDFLHSFFEANPTSWGQLTRGVYECGVVYLGFRVPAWMEQPGQLSQVWDRRGDVSEQEVGGHCVVAVGYDGANRMLRVCSWGQWYWMTMAFIEGFVSEAYPLVSADWVGRPGGVCPLNLTLADLDEQMAALRT